MGNLSQWEVSTNQNCHSLFVNKILLQRTAEGLDIVLLVKQDTGRFFSYNRCTFSGHVVAPGEQTELHPVQRLCRHVRGEPRGQGEVLLRNQHRRRVGCWEGQEW